jgi:hydrogenase expression/formation protein HypC
MCLAVPGKIISIEKNSLGMTLGRVSFAGIIKDVSLAYVPDAELGDYVVVHVGFALSKIDEQQAGEIFEFLKMNTGLDELSEEGLRGPGSVEPGT